MLKHMNKLLGITFLFNGEIYLPNFQFFPLVFTYSDFIIRIIFNFGKLPKQQNHTWTILEGLEILRKLCVPGS